MSLTRYNWLVDRQPTQNRYTVVGDVTGSIEVSMEFKTAVTTQVLGSVPVTFVDVTAGRTLLRGVPGINGDNLLTYIFGFVSDKPLQFVERPVVQFPIKLCSTSLLHTDFRQIFKCKHGVGELNNMLRDTVVGISHKPSFSTRQLPEFPGSGSSAFGLEFRSEMCVFTTDILHSRRIKKCVVGTDCNVDNTPINPENRLFGNNLRSVRFKLAVQIKRIVVLTKRQRRRFDLPSQVLPVIPRNTKRGFDPTIRCSDSCIPGSQKHIDNPRVVSHCRILFTKRFKLTFHRFQAFTSNVSCALYQRGREIWYRLSNIVIGGIVAVNLADGVGLKAPLRADVKSHSIISHGLQERLPVIRRNIKFQLNRPNHNHILVVIEHILNGGDRCGAIPPTAKAVGFLAPRS